jgi:hypothetical protein
MSHEPLQVTIWVQAPISLNHPWLHFDGIVSHLIHRRVLGRAYYDLPTKRVQHLSAHVMGPYRDLLLQTAGINHGSASVFGPDVRYATSSYFKRFEPRFAPRAFRRVELGRGRFRVWMLRAVLVSCAWVRFYCCAKRALLEDLLNDLWGVSDDTRIGWGRIWRIEIEPVPECYCLVYQGRATRPIPIYYLRHASEVVPLAWRPPYWARESIALCAPPGAEVELGEDLARHLSRLQPAS